MKSKLVILIIILFSLSSCAINLKEKNPKYIGVWESSNSVININEKGFIDYYSKYLGMNGQGTIFNDKEILFWVIIIPKKFRITKPMEEVNGIFYIGLDGIIYKKISNEPKKKHSFL